MKGMTSRTTDMKAMRPINNASINNVHQLTFRLAREVQAFARPAVLPVNADRAMMEVVEEYQ
jgi:hypothetical protein